jgi:hypothetical protein
MQPPELGEWARPLSGASLLTLGRRSEGMNVGAVLENGEKRLCDLVN